jgi:hypothetical protein
LPSHKPKLRAFLDSRVTEWYRSHIGNWYRSHIGDSRGAVIALQVVNDSGNSPKMGPVASLGDELQDGIDKALSCEMLIRELGEQSSEGLRDDYFVEAGGSVNACYSAHLRLDQESANIISHVTNREFNAHLQLGCRIRTRRERAHTIRAVEEPPLTSLGDNLFAACNFSMWLPDSIGATHASSKS